MRNKDKLGLWLVVFAAGCIGLACSARAAADTGTIPRLAAAGDSHKPAKPVKEKKEKKKKKKKRLKILINEPGGRIGQWMGEVPFKNRGFLGVGLVEITPELRTHYGAPGGAGVLVGSVSADSPAAKAGIQVGDVLVAVDGKQIGSSWEAVRTIGKHKKGDKVSLKLMRARKAHTLTAVLDERTKPQVEISRWVHKHGSGDEEIEILVDPDSIGDVVERYHEMVEEHLGGEEGQKMFLFKKREKEERRLEKRMQELEEKLRRLEKKLQGAAASKTRARPG